MTVWCNSHIWFLGVSNHWTGIWTTVEWNGLWNFVYSREHHFTLYSSFPFHSVRGVSFIAGKATSYVQNPYVEAK